MFKKTLASPTFELKAAADGSFEGYASVFGETDSYGEATDPGSFADSLAAIKASGRPLPVLWQHDQTNPIGTFSALAEDSKGLHVKGALLLDVQSAREAKARIDAKAVSGLSIGYMVRGDRIDKQTGVRHLTNIDLHEISVVTFPAGPGARITSVKSMSLEDLEDALRDGTLPRLSNREAKKFMAAFRAMQRQDDPDDAEELSKLAATLTQFNQFLTKGK